VLTRSSNNAEQGAGEPSDRVAAHGDQTLLRDGRGHPVGRQHRPPRTASAVTLDRDGLAEDRAVPVSPEHPNAVHVVSCGQILSNQWGVIVDSERGTSFPRQRREIWLHGDMSAWVWGRDDEDRSGVPQQTANHLASGSHAEELQPKDSGCGRAISASTSPVSCKSPGVSRTGHRSTAATTTPGHRGDGLGVLAGDPQWVRGGVHRGGPHLPLGIRQLLGEQLVIVAERGTGAGRTALGPVADASVRPFRDGTASHRRFRLVAAGVILVPPVASRRRASRADYFTGALYRPTPTNA